LNNGSRKKQFQNGRLVTNFEWKNTFTSWWKISMIGGNTSRLSLHSGSVQDSRVSFGEFGLVMLFPHYFYLISEMKWLFFSKPLEPIGIGLLINIIRTLSLDNQPRCPFENRTHFKCCFVHVIILGTHNGWWKRNP